MGSRAGKSVEVLMYAIVSIVATKSNLTSSI